MSEQERRDEERADGAEPAFPPTDPGDEALGGVVTLVGWVRSLADRAAVEETAWQTRGVRHVRDRAVVIGA